MVVLFLETNKFPTSGFSLRSMNNFTYLFQTIINSLKIFFLQSTSYSLFDYFIIFLGPGTVLFFTFYLLWAGRRKNHKIMNVARESLLEVFSKEFTDLVPEKFSSNGGLLFPTYNKAQNIPFKDFRVVFALEERHLMLNVIISWFSGANDYIALEANPKKGKVPTKVEIIPQNETGQIKKHQNVLFQLDDIKLGVTRLDDFFVIKASSQRSGMYLLGDKTLLKHLYNNRDALVRISVDSTEDPSIRVYTRIKKDLDLQKLYELFLALCWRINDVSEKKVMKKKQP
ncbi:MAG: hypothetical protein EAX86_00185 [Candidatus Heimdallarchaeota archaeon]|nr:hypothetical protein [Candidatus Heimdallarchaeota archaeon]